MAGQMLCLEGALARVHSKGAAGHIGWKSMLTRGE